MPITKSFIKLCVNTKKYVSVTLVATMTDHVSNRRSSGSQLHCKDTLMMMKAKTITNDRTRAYHFHYACLC
jgi:hypothetical protein